jgi:uncharacterized protein DUF6893
MRKLVTTLFLLAVGAVVVQNLPDIRRYMRIKRM